MPSGSTSANDIAVATPLDPPCDHFICVFTEEQFDFVLTKIEECDAEISIQFMLEHPLVHFRRFLAFWLKEENKHFIDSHLCSIYISQATFRLLDCGEHAFLAFCVRACYALLISMVVEQCFVDSLDFDSIKVTCALVQNDASLVHFLNQVIPCQCLDELAMQFVCPVNLLNLE